MSNHFNIIFLFLTLLFTSQTQAVELCLSIDGSASISDPDFQLQIGGIAASVENPLIIPQNSSVSISVVQFSNTTQIVAGSTLIDSQATATTLANTIRAMSQIKSTTNIDAGIAACASTFVTDGRQVIDISTDGDPTPPVSTSGRTAALAQGVDVINAMGIGPDVTVDKLNAIVYPQPASAVPEEPGFVLLADTFDDFTTAFEAKIKAEVVPDPDPVVPDPVGPRPIPSNDIKPIPTLSEWGLIILSLLMLAVTMRDKKFRNT